MTAYLMIGQCQHLGGGGTALEKGFTWILLQLGTFYILYGLQRFYDCFEKWFQPHRASMLLSRVQFINASHTYN